MSDERAIGVGQVWRHKRTGRLVRISSYDAPWDDASYRWVEGKGGGLIYGCNLRRGYELVEDRA